MLSTHPVRRQKCSARRPEARYFGEQSDSQQARKAAAPIAPGAAVGSQVQSILPGRNEEIELLFDILWCDGVRSIVLSTQIIPAELHAPTPTIATSK